MKRSIKYTLFGLGILLSLVIIAFLSVIGYKAYQSSQNMALLGAEAPSVSVDGYTYRDLNKNGQLDKYEDSRTNIDERVSDLISQMTLEEKAGSMFVNMIAMTDTGGPVEGPVFDNMMFFMMSMMLPTNSEMIAVNKLNSFNTINSGSAETMAIYNNTIQKMAERTRLGIPITIATDPRHATENNPGAAVYTPAFSTWPSSLGLAATRDTALVREFADIARQEYTAVGIRLALHPMADLATEPRWGRINGTFGEDADLSAKMTKAYVLGFQGDSLGKQSVACMTKHFSGGGPQKDGEDAHFPYGKEQVYPGNNFDYHIRPFIEGAFPAKTAQIMPYYGIPIDQTSENVGFAFNKDIIKTLLRDSLDFDGVVCADWNIITDGALGEGRAWGVEELSPLQRVKKVIDAGCDQFGGEMVPELIVELVKTGQISEDRIDVSIARILRDKFILGLFDDPYVDPEKAERLVGNDQFQLKGIEAQRKSTILLKNEGLLPLKKGIKVFVSGLENTEVFDNYAQVVKNPSDADVIFKRLYTPFEKRDEYFLEGFFNQGRLYFTDEEIKETLALLENKPSIVAIQLERPALFTEINNSADAVLADFGTNDEILVEALFGKFSPSGKLPFELPSSQEAVEKQLADVPYDSENPLYPFGHGLSY